MAQDDYKAFLARRREDSEKRTRPRDGAASNRGGDNASYPFWTMDVGARAKVRFIRDADLDNPWMFYVNREVIKLPFAGIVGGDYPTSRPVMVNVPCMEMWGETCPIITAIRPWWTQDRELARTYYKKRSYIFQGFVLTSPFKEETVPENPIRRFVINPQIFKVIDESQMNADFEDAPYDPIGGRDFKIAKTMQGEHNNYSTSMWEFSTRALSETEQNAIAQYGAWDLKQFQGAKPDGDGVAMIKAMFDASVAGEPFDVASFGGSYRAYGRDREERTNDDEALGNNHAAARPASQHEATDLASSAASAAAASATAPATNAADVIARLTALREKTRSAV